MEKRKPKYIQIRKYNEDGTDEIEFVYIVDDFANRSLEKNDYETYKNLKSKKERNDFLTKFIRKDSDVRFNLLNKGGADNLAKALQCESIDFEDLLTKERKPPNVGYYRFSDYVEDYGFPASFTDSD